MEDSKKPSGWSSCSKEALNAAVDIFCSFIAKPDRAAVEQWVLKRAKPSEIYLKSPDDYEGWWDWYGALFELFGEDSEAEADEFLREFVRRFLPNTQEWFDLKAEYEGRDRFISLYGRSLELVGKGPYHEWSDTEIDLLDQILDCWKFDYSYGIWKGSEGPSEGPLCMWGSCDTDFFGRGRWKFSDLLAHLDKYTREWFAAHGGPEKEYAELLRLMEKDCLEIKLDFTDGLFDGGATHETGRLYSDGTVLHYRRDSVRPCEN